MTSRDQLNEERRKRLLAEESLRQRTRDANERINELKNAVEASRQAAAAKQAVERAAERTAEDLKRSQVLINLLVLFK